MANLERNKQTVVAFFTRAFIAPAFRQSRFQLVLRCRKVDFVTAEFIKDRE